MIASFHRTSSSSPFYCIIFGVLPLAIFFGLFIFVISSFQSSYSAVHNLDIHSYVLQNPSIISSLREWNFTIPNSSLNASHLTKSLFYPTSIQHSNPYFSQLKHTSAASQQTILFKQAKLYWIRKSIGCGGTFRRSPIAGDSVFIRYVAFQNGIEIDRSQNDLEPIGIQLFSSNNLNELAPFRALHEALKFTCKSDIFILSLPTKFTRSRSNPLLPEFPYPHDPVQFLLLVESIRFSSQRIEADSIDIEEEEEFRRDALNARLVTISGRLGESCEKACARSNMDCEKAGFELINQCPRLQQVMKCQQCEVAALGSAGPDMPCLVSQRAPLGHPRGFCMVAPNVQFSTCAASYRHTFRLCPCLPRQGSRR